MKIAIFGATSQIARDLIGHFAASGDPSSLHLFARRPEAAAKWLHEHHPDKAYPVSDFSEFGGQQFDAIINFIGVSDPAQAVAMGSSIFDITLHFDKMILNYLQAHPACRYLFLSSGAAYGSGFKEPVTGETPATVFINNLQPHEWYGVAKLYAECRHRALADLPIIDIRVFNYFSRSQDLSARFLMSDILRAIRDQSILQTSSEYIVRDFLHPSDFHRLICALLAAPKENAAVDCYSRATVDKPALLKAMQKQFGLQYEISDASSSPNATGSKPYYYSLNKRASDFGYQPALTSLEGISTEVAAILGIT